MKRAVCASLVLTTLATLSCGEAEPDEDFGVDPSFTEEAFYATDADVGGAYVAGDPADQVAADDGGDFLAVVPPSSFINPELVAARAATSVDRYFSPAGCASATLQETEVSYSVTRCAGPLGLRDVTGEIIVRYGSSDDQLTLTVTSSDLTAGGRAVSLDLDATLSVVSETERRLSVTSNSSVDGAHSIVYRDVSFEVRYVQGSGCVEVTGRGNVTIDERDFEYTLDGYSRCTGLCPESGTLTLEDGDDSASLRFDGSDQPDYVRSDQRSGEVQLDCEP